MLKKILFGSMLAACLSCGLQAEGRVTAIMRALDATFDLRADITAKVNFTQQKANQGVKTLEMVYYRRDSDDSFLIVMTAPEAEKGNGYLRVGDNFWMYRKNTRTFQHINRDESIAGTDASADDFEKRKLIELYQPILDIHGEEVLASEKLGEIPVFKIKLQGQKNNVKYPVLTYWVRQDNYLPLKEQSFALSGVLMETAYYLKYTKIADKHIFVKAMFIDEFEKNNKTIVEITGISTQPIADSVFTKAYLENLSK